MTKNEKTIANLADKDISCRETNGTVYVCINDTELELAQYEIDYQANDYDEKEKEE